MPWNHGHVPHGIVGNDVYYMKLAVSSMIGCR